jgi:hypothetical protein
MMQGPRKAFKLFSGHLRLSMAFRGDQRLLQARPRCTNHRQTETTNNFFRYTSGRWLYDEHLQFERRFVKFNVQALQQVASKVLGAQCVQMTKLPEGLYNKVFSLKMENGEEVLARIPNPNAGHPQYCVASEVATLDFVSAIQYLQLIY